MPDWLPAVEQFGEGFFVRKKPSSEFSRRNVLRGGTTLAAASAWLQPRQSKPRKPNRPPSAAVVSVADDRRGIVWKHSRHGREVADLAVDHAKQIDDRGLVGCDAVEVAH